MLRTDIKQVGDDKAGHQMACHCTARATDVGGDMRMQAKVVSVIACVLIVGCSQNNSPTQSTAQLNSGPAVEGPVVLGASGKIVQLTPAQLQVVQAGVGQMIGTTAGGAVTLAQTKALSVADRPGLQVCGMVKPAAGGTSVPYYLELGDVGGTPTALRGQVASDKARLAKIRFVCRHHAGTLSTAEATASHTGFGD